MALAMADLRAGALRGSSVDLLLLVGSVGTAALSFDPVSAIVAPAIAPPVTTSPAGVASFFASPVAEGAVSERAALSAGAGSPALSSVLTLSNS